MSPNSGRDKGKLTSLFEMYTILCIVIFLGCLFIEPAAVGVGGASMVITFFGLLAAGIVPAMSLLVGVQTSPTKSVVRLNNLKASLTDTLWRLGGVLATVILGSFAIIFSQMPFPSPAVPAEVLDALPSHIHGLLNSPLQRLFLAVACVCLFLSLDRLRIVFSTFKAVLNARFEIAVEEAGRTLTEKAESSVSIEAVFPQSPKFGRRVPLGQTNEV